MSAAVGSEKPRRPHHLWGPMRPQPGRQMESEHMGPRTQRGAQGRWALSAPGQTTAGSTEQADQCPRVGVPQGHRPWTFQRQHQARHPPALSRKQRTPQAAAPTMPQVPKLQVHDTQGSSARPERPQATEHLVAAGHQTSDRAVSGEKDREGRIQQVRRKVGLEHVGHWGQRRPRRLRPRPWGLCQEQSCEDNSLP